MALNMSDRRLWSLLVIVLVALVTLYQLTAEPPPSSPASPPYALYANASPYSHPMDTLPADDYRRLIDLGNFSFTMLTPCNDTAPLLLVMVHSDPKNRERRDVVRRTWGRSTSGVRVLFVVGLVRGEAGRELERENEEHGDLVQGSFYDAYRNMTYKHVAVFKYAIYHCPRATYILKTDDDVFVNMPLMRRFLAGDLSPHGGARMLFCTVRRRSAVVRSWRSKWRVSFGEYRARTYPPYCPGWAVLYSPDVVFALYREAQRAPYFWIDDVHITGTLAERLGLQHVDVDGLVLGRAEMEGVLRRGGGGRRFLYGAPNARNDEIEALWGAVGEGL